MAITQKDLQSMIKSEAGQSAVISLVLRFQSELDDTLKVLESHASRTRESVCHSIDWAHSQVEESEL